MTLVTVEVGARWVPNITAFSKLQSLLGLTNKAAKDLMTKTCGQAIKGSHRFWCMRNLIEPPYIWERGREGGRERGGGGGGRAEGKRREGEKGGGKETGERGKNK